MLVLWLHFVGFEGSVLTRLWIHVLLLFMGTFREYEVFLITYIRIHA